jgi:cation diffusion facilitator family transporter
MHIHTLEKWRHSHDFSLIHEKGEKRTTQVLVLTAVMMTLEILAGEFFGSMALLADGWHMGTHAAAFAISIFAYRYARRHASDSAFSFGTGKVSVLGGYASAVALAVIALLMALESVERLFKPQRIQFNEAIAVAAAGLLINLLCAAILRDHHPSIHAHPHPEPHTHHDHNLKAAYLHVLADALTSLLALIALTFGKYFGWVWLDPFMGIVGALVITHWSYGLLKETSSILLDRCVDGTREIEVKAAIETDSDNRVSDIHIWKVGPVHYALIVSLVTHFPKETAHYKKLLAGFKELSHVTIEVNHCQDSPCLSPTAERS